MDQLDAIPRDGVSLAAIGTFLAAVRPSDVAGLSTSSVVHRFVEPFTSALRCSYADTLRNRPDSRELVAPATVFISHAWGMTFDALVAALRALQSNSSTVLFFWLDVFVNNQHAAPNRPFEWWQSVFRANIHSIGRTVVVLEWDAPRPLSRAWCLWELACSLLNCVESRSAASVSPDPGPLSGGGSVPAVQPACTFQVAMPPASEAEFAEALVQRFDSIVHQTCSIDVSTATAYHGGECSRDGAVCPVVAAGGACPRDLERIHAAVGQLPGGQYEVTKRIIAAMKEWMITCGRAALARLPAGDDRDASDFQLAFSQLLRHSGHLADAAPLLTCAVAARTRMWGEDHPATLEAKNDAALLLRLRGRLSEARVSLEEVLVARQRVLGADSAATLVTANALALCEQELGRFEHAEGLFRDVLAARRRVLGDAHPATIGSMNNLGLLLRSRGELEAAEPLFTEALAAFRAALRPEHPSALWSLHSCALVLDDQGKLGAAEPLFREALSGRRRVLGDAHPDTLASVTGLALNLHAQGRLAEAEPLFREAVAARRAVLGSEHAVTAGSEVNLALLLRDAGSLDEALRLVHGALDVFSRVLGPQHPSTRWCGESLSGILAASTAAASDQKPPEGGVIAVASSSACQRLEPGRLEHAVAAEGNGAVPAVAPDMCDPASVERAPSEFDTYPRRAHLRQLLRAARSLGSSSGSAAPPLVSRHRQRRLSLQAGGAVSAELLELVTGAHEVAEDCEGTD